MRNIFKLWCVVVLVACSADPAPVETGVAADLITAPCDYVQAFGTAKHTGLMCPEVKGMHVAQVIVQDPDAAAENAFSGFLQIHEPAPLTSGDMVIVPGHSGFGGDGFDRTHDVWNLQAFRWTPSVLAPDARLLPAWKAVTTWKPVDALFGGSGFGAYTNGYVMGFWPAVANRSVYQPAVAGTVQRLNLLSGAAVSTIDPLKETPFTGDAFTAVTTGLSVDSKGNVYYAITAFPTSGNRNDQPRGSWIAIVHPDDTAELIDFVALAASAGLPAAHDLCEYPFGTGGTPDPTGPDSVAPRFGCGVQRPNFNAPIAVDDNGDMVVTSAANNARATFVLKISGATHQVLWAADTRQGLTYGCGRRADATFGACPVLTNQGITNLGVDPRYNLPIHWTGTDLMDNAPTIAPNGDVSFGSYDSGFSFGGNFDARGSALLFDRDGNQVGKNERFAWEVTPAVVFGKAGTFGYAGDLNEYSAFNLAVATYDARFGVLTQGSIPLDETRNAIDWLDANVSVGADGSYYAVSGQGLAVKFDAAGKQVDQVVLPNADGTGQLSMETLSGYQARDRAGRLYFSYAGNVYVVDGTGTLNGGPVPVPLQSVSPALQRGLKAKWAGARQVLPMPVVP